MRILMISRQSLYKVPGGDAVQLMETAKSLAELGVEVDVKLAHEEIDYSNYDLLHFFNIIRPNEINVHVEKSQLPYVISTIFVDYSEVEKFHRGFLFKLLMFLIGSDGLNFVKTIGRVIVNKESLLDRSYLFKGHKRSIIKLLNEASLLLPNSHNEFKRLQKAYKFKNEYHVIPNASAEEFFQENDEKKKGIICVARIEVIKNQLNLIKAIKDTDLELKIIGKAAPNHYQYFQKCVAEAGPNIEFIGQLSKEDVKKEMKKAKVHILPSFFETTGLSSLEAAASSCNIIITPKGDTEEYFGEKAFYCDPDDPISIRNALHEAHEADVDPSLKKLIYDNYRWSIAAQKTKEAYLSVLGKNKDV